MQQLHEKIADINTRYYDLRGEIVKAERRITTLTERGEMWKQYNLSLIHIWDNRLCGAGHTQSG